MWFLQLYFIYLFISRHNFLIFQYGQYGEGQIEKRLQLTFSQLTNKTTNQSVYRNHLEDIWGGGGGGEVFTAHALTRYKLKRLTFTNDLSTSS